jgi:hypothetical protein
MKRLFLAFGVVGLLASAFAEPIVHECGLPLLGPMETRARPTLSGTEYTQTSDHFKIHYCYSGDDATTYAWACSTLAFAEQVYDCFVTDRGWTTWPPDGTLGGDSKYDIYIWNTVGAGYYGVCVPEDPYTVLYPDGYTSFVSVCKDSVGQPFPKYRRLAALVAHELGHGLQIAYSKFESPLWAFYENTSVWMEDACFDDVNTLYYRLQTYSPNPQDNPYYAINTTQGQYEYPGAMWAHFLDEYYGNYSSSWDALKMMWWRLGDHAGSHLLDDWDYMLSEYYDSDLQAAMNHYAIWRYFTGTNYDYLHYDEASSYEPVNILRSHSSYPASGNEGTQDPDGPGGCNYIEFTNGGDNVLTVSFNGQNGYDWGAYCLGISGFTSYEYKLILNSSGDGSTQIPFEDYSKVILIPVVDEWLSGANNLTYTYSASLSSNVDVAENSGFVPMNYRLFDPVPNPVSSDAKLMYQLPEAAEVSLRVFDAGGRVVRSLKSGHVEVGVHTLHWDGRDENGARLANGLYFLTMTAGDYVGTSKLILTGQGR